MDDGLSDIVRDYRLVTQFGNGHTIHIFDDPDAPPYSPPRLEHWKKCRTIYQSDQGQVVLEECTSGARGRTQRAVKIIRLQDDGAQRRYKRELEAIIKFSRDKYSKYFVKTLGWYTSSQKLYIAMEYFPTGDLHGYVAKYGRLLEDDCRTITGQLLRGLAAMHEESFAHRDVKPKNVLIHQCPPSAWWVKLVDFGISKRIEADTSASSKGCGTIQYMAPEILQLGQSTGPDVDDQAADMWALGVTIFFLLTNTLPFPSLYSTIEYSNNPEGHFPRVPLNDSQVSEIGHDFIRALMMPDPQKRLDSDTAICHEWMSSWLPEMPRLSNIYTRSSISSSRRSSFDYEEEMPTQTTQSASLPYSKQWSVEASTSPGFSPEFHAIGQGHIETKTLHEAAKDGHVQVINQLLNNGADVSSRDKDGWTPIELALSNGHDAVVKLLLDKGADLERRDPDGHTLLMDSAYIGDQTMVHLLINQGANLEATDNTGNTPLVIAARGGHTGVVQVLVDSGANLEAKTNTGNTPLLCAAIKGHKDVVQVLVDNNADLDAKSGNGNTALFLAITNRHTEVVQVLLEKGSSLKAKSKNGASPLSLAVSRGYKEVVQVLVDKSAELEAKGENGNTPLLLAIINGQADVAQVLVEKGADLETKNKNGNTPLSLAVSKGNKDMVQMLIKKGADIEARSEKGNTPLLLAAMKGHMDVVQLLVKKGANLEAKNDSRDTPLLLALEKEHDAVVKFLLERGARKGWRYRILQLNPTPEWGMTARQPL